MRKLSWVIAGVLYASLPAVGQSAELGVATVNSNLTEPLSVRIPLNVSAQHPLDEVNVGLAPAEAYDEAGLGMEGIIGNIRFDVVEDGQQAYVDVTSRRPITEPILTLLLQARSGQGSMIRRYTLLLDPPAETRTPPSPPETAEPATAPEPLPPVAPVSTWQRVADVPELDMTGRYHVERGDTLYNIARQYVDHERDVRPMMQAIIDANPQAFVNGDGNSLFADVTLEVPESTDAPTEATGETEPPISDDADAEATTVDADEGAEVDESAEAPAEVAADSEPMLSLLDVEQAQAATADEADVDPIQEEELLALQSQNESLQSQLAEVGDEISAMQEALQLRDAQLADLQEQVDVSQERTAEARAEALALEDELRAQQNNFFVTWGPYLTGVLGLIIIALALALLMRRDARAKEVAAEQNLARTDVPADSHSKSGLAASAAAGVAVGQMTAADESDADNRNAADDDAFADEPVVDDEGDAFADQDDASGTGSSLTPEAAAEEARVLASFNLNSQAEEMLQEALQSHPEHPVLLAAMQEIREEGSEDDQAVEDGSSVMDADASPSADDADEEVYEAPLDDDLAFEQTESSAAEHSSTDDEPLDLPDFDEQSEFSSAQEQSEGKEASSANQEDELEFDLSDYQPAGEPETKSAGDFVDADETMDLELPGSDTQPAAEKNAGQTDDDADAFDLPSLDDEPSAPDAGDAAAFSPDEQEPDLDLPAEQADEAVDDDQVDTRVGLAEAFLEMGDQDGFEMIEAELRDENDSVALAKLEEIKQRYS